MMELQYQIIYIALILTIATLGIGTIVYIILEVINTKQYIEMILQLMAISAGVMAIGVSLFTGKTIPELITIKLLNANLLSGTVLLYGYLLPILSGVCTGLFLIKWFTARSSQSFRILCFLNALVVTFSFISIAMVYDELILQRQIDNTISSLTGLQININKVKLYLNSKKDKVDKFISSEKKLADIAIARLHSSIDTMMDGLDEKNPNSFELHNFYNSVTKHYYDLINAGKRIKSMPHASAPLASQPNSMAATFPEQGRENNRITVISDLNKSIFMAISSLSERKKIQFTRILVPNLNFLLSVFIYIILMYQPKKEIPAADKPQETEEDFCI